MVPLRTVDGTAHRIDHQPSRHRFALDGGVQLEGGIERLLAAAISDEFDGAEQAPPPDIADMGMVGKTLFQK